MTHTALYIICTAEYRDVYGKKMIVVEQCRKSRTDALFGSEAVLSSKQNSGSRKGQVYLGTVRTFNTSPRWNRPCTGVPLNQQALRFLLCQNVAKDKQNVSTKKGPPELTTSAHGVPQPRSNHTFAGVAANPALCLQQTHKRSHEGRGWPCA